MVDWLGGKRVGRWTKFGFLLMAYFFGVLAFGLGWMVFAIIISIPYPPGLVMVPLGLFGILVIIWALGAMWQRANSWMKAFNFKDEIVVQVIDNLLRNEKIMYRRLSLEGSTGRFPLRYAEIFAIENSKTEIRVQRAMYTGTFVGIGPVYGNPDGCVDFFKERIDDAFLPRGLELAVTETVE